MKTAFYDSDPAIECEAPKKIGVHPIKNDAAEKE